MEEITEFQLITALQEAFTCYLAYLSHTQKSRESKLPRQGKDIETTSDLSTQHNFLSRIAATETCLQYTRKIARNVKKWNSNPVDQAREESITGGVPEVVSLETLVKDLEEHHKPFLDTFSGSWINPITSYSAGPSGSSDRASATNSPIRESLKTKALTTREQADVIDKSLEEDLMKRHLASRAPTRAESGIYRNTPLSNSRNSRHKHRVYPPYPPSTKATIGIHPNIPISVRDLSPDRYYSAPSSRGTSRAPPTPASSTSSRDNDLESVTSEEATAYYEGFRQSQRAAEDAEYAKRLEKEEQRRKEELDRQFSEARRLADEWTREETARLRAQAQLAERLEREEREAAERIRRNREAARRAQEQWEAAAIARETEVMRAEERRRRDEIEERRAGDEQRRLRIERERGWAEEISERNRLIAEEKRRREEQNIAEGLRRRAQANKRRDAEPPKQVDCVSCMEPGDERDMAVLPCDHGYCGECIKGAFKSAYKSQTPFKCCSTTIPTYTVQRHLSQSFITKYNLMVLELSTPKPKYCSSRSCNKFIPPNKIKGPVATCPSCRTRTCVSCLKKEHSGVCAEDKEGKAVEALAKRKGWKQCPQCSWILERTEGCLHMTCRCGAEWCYSCLREWRVCNSTCGRSGGERAFVFPPAEEGFAGGGAARMWERDRVAPGGGGGAAILFPIAAAVLMGILNNDHAR